jgi:uncharacterized protein (DUF2384 family)
MVYADAHLSAQINPCFFPASFLATLKEVEIMAHMVADPRALKVAEIIAHAASALDGQKNASSWLQKPNQRMGGRTPHDVLLQGEPSELQQLDDLLTALDYGMHS